MAAENNIVDRRETTVERNDVQTRFVVTVFENGTHILTLDTYPTGLSAMIHLTAEEYATVVRDVIRPE